MLPWTTTIYGIYVYLQRDGRGIGSFKGEVESFEDRTDVVISRMYE